MIYGQRMCLQAVERGALLRFVAWPNDLDVTAGLIYRYSANERSAFRVEKLRRL